MQNRIIPSTLNLCFSKYFPPIHQETNSFFKSGISKLSYKLKIKFSMLKNKTKKIKLKNRWKNVNIRKVTKSN